MSGSPNLQQFTAEQIAQEQRRGVLVLDTRPAEQFASFHIPGSMQLGLMGPFASWAGIHIKTTQELLLVAESMTAAEEAASRLARVGLKHVLGFVLADKKHWQNHGLTLASLPIHWSQDVCRHLREGRPFQLIDVRSTAEWLKGHLPGQPPCRCLSFIPKQHPSISPGLVLCTVTKDIAPPPRPVCCFGTKP